MDPCRKVKRSLWLLHYETLYTHQFACCHLHFKLYSNPITSLDRPWGFQEAEAPRFQDNRHMKVVRLSELRTGRLYPPENIPGTHFFYRLSQPQGHSAAGRIMSMKNSNDTIGNRTRDLQACSAVPQPTAPTRIPFSNCTFSNIQDYYKRNRHFQRYVVSKPLAWWTHNLRSSAEGRWNFFFPDILSWRQHHVSALEITEAKWLLLW